MNKRHVIRQQGDQAFEHLRLGVPITTDDCTLGLIEVAQRDVCDQHVQSGDVRFVSQMGKIVSPLAATLRDGQPT